MGKGRETYIHRGDELSGYEQRRGERDGRCTARPELLLVGGMSLWLCVEVVVVWTTEEL